MFLIFFVFFFFNDTATTEIYTLSLHDALPILTQRFAPERRQPAASSVAVVARAATSLPACGSERADRKSTRLNSSHVRISYAVFCLKKKKQNQCTEVLYVRK